jgi:hypothetical protein
MSHRSVEITLYSDATPRRCIQSKKKQNCQYLEGLLYQMKNKFLGYRYLGCTGTSEKEERLNGIKTPC